MSVLLTGATGFIGTSVLARLIEEGHEVTALVRSEEKARLVESAGATPLIGDIADSALLTRAAAESDGVIHTANTGGPNAGVVDAAVAEAVIAGLGASGRAYVHTGGIWSFGSNPDITEDSAENPGALSTFRPPIERRVRGAEGIRGIVIAPAVVYGHGKGLPNIVVHAPRSTGAAPALRLVGDGTQHWATVYVEDLAALYVLAFETAAAGSLYIGASGQNPTVRELGEVAARAASLAARVEAESTEASRERLGAAFADALLLDQQATGTAARIDLGWEPNGPSLIEEISAGSYTPAG
jgi:Nucleoside-diphosphate-sugar epimerases